MPIYYVIVEQFPNYNQMAVWIIHKVIECDIEDTERLYRTEAMPLYQQGRRIQTMYFYREPPNPIKEQAIA